MWVRGTFSAVNMRSASGSGAFAKAFPVAEQVCIANVVMFSLFLYAGVLLLGSFWEVFCCAC